MKLVATRADRLPALFQAAPDSGRRFWEFFTLNIRNPHTRRAYFKAVETFAAWCDDRGLHDLAGVTPMHVAAYVEQLGRTHAKPTVKQHLAAIRFKAREFATTGNVGSRPINARSVQLAELSAPRASKLFSASRYGSKALCRYDFWSLA